MSDDFLFHMHALAAANDHEAKRFIRGLSLITPYASLRCDPDLLDLEWVVYVKQPAGTPLSQQLRDEMKTLGWTVIRRPHRVPDTNLWFYTLKEKPACFA